MPLSYRPDVIGYLMKKGIDPEVHPHRNTYTAPSEARAVGMSPRQVLKTVVLRTSTGYVVAVIPASSRVDLRSVARYLQDQATRVATEDELATKFPGFEIGAIPPLPGLLGVTAYVDPRVFDHEKVGFTDGRHRHTVTADPRRVFWGENCFVYPVCVDDTWSFEGDAVRVEEFA